MHGFLTGGEGGDSEESAGGEAEESINLAPNAGGELTLVTAKLPDLPPSHSSIARWVMKSQTAVFFSPPSPTLPRTPHVAPWLILP